MRNEKQLKKNRCHTERSRSMGAVAPPPFSGGGWEGVDGASANTKKHLRSVNEAYSMVNSSSRLAQATPPLPLPSTCSGQALFRREVLCALLLITLLLITNNQIHAQSPYTGGSGDGHAMGELVLKNVAVTELTTTDGYLIYPALAKTGETIYITCPVAGELQLIDITGRIIHTQTLEQPVQQMPVVVTQAGLCIGIIRTQAGTFTQKIIVVK